MAPVPTTPLSKNHRLVHEIVTEQGPGTHLSMAQLFELARRRRPGIGFTTVYRALMRLRDHGLVSEILIPGADGAVYEPAAAPHAHFRCSQCGTIADLNYRLPSSIADEIAAQNGFNVESVEISLHGRCANCVTTS